MRCVIKIGSNLLVKEDGKIDEEYVMRIARQVSYVKHLGHQVVIVSSGARAGGYGLVRTEGMSISEKQALCAIGQIELMRIYSEKFKIFKMKVAQLLLTRDDFTNRRRFLNIRNTLISLERFGIVPIVNENDTVAIDEMKLGDNDTLSAYVAIGWGADILMLFTTVDGVLNEEGKVIERYKNDEQLLRIGNSRWGTGGIYTKIEAAKMSSSAGVRAVIMNGKTDALLDFLNGKRIGTEFLPGKKIRARKAWIGFMTKPQGRIYIDKGAADALMNGKSLLPVGIIEVKGAFDRGDTVEIINDDHLIGRGIVDYSIDEVLKILDGNKKEYDEVCHADNLIIR